MRDDVGGVVIAPKRAVALAVDAAAKTVPGAAAPEKRHRAATHANAPRTDRHIVPSPSPGSRRAHVRRWDDPRSIVVLWCDPRCKNVGAPAKNQAEGASTPAPPTRLSPSRKDGAGGGGPDLILPDQLEPDRTRLDRHSSSWLVRPSLRPSAHSPLRHGQALTQ